MVTILKKELKLFFKRKGNFFWLIGMPILFIFVMNAVFGNTDNVNITLHVIDHDQSTSSKQFLKQLGHISGIKVQQEKVSSWKDQIDQLKKGSISTFLVIPKGFGNKLTSGQQAELQLHRDGSTNQAAAAVASVLDNMSNQYREYKIKEILRAKGNSNSEIDTILQSPIVMKTINVGSTKVNAVTQIVPGYMIMFVFYIIITMVRSFTDEQKSGMVSRIKSTSLRSWEYLLGMWLPNIFKVILQCAVLLAFGHFVYDLELGNVVIISLIVLCLAICGTGLGLAISFLVETETAGLAITQILTLGGAMLGGLWVPYDLLPTTAQIIGHFTPQYWAQHGMQEVMAHGAKLADIWPTFAVLLAFGLGGLIIALLRYPRYLSRAVS